MARPITPHEKSFRIVGARSEPPVVLSSPHSGREYPPAFLAQSRLSLSQLRRAEDAYVDDLLAESVAVGVPLIAARYGRAFLDLNRDADEIDPAMVADPMPPSAGHASDRVAAGLGVVPRIAAQGLDIYATRLRLADINARVAALHRPYHNALAELIQRARQRHGYAVLLDCHSMPTPPGGAGAAPQFVLGDLHGQSASPRLTEIIETQLRRDGFRTARNAPYAGGYTTLHHADPAAGVHVVQIEIDRALYMDPARLVRHAGFATVSSAMKKLISLLLALSPSLGLEGGQRMAAE